MMSTYSTVPSKCGLNRGLVWDTDMDDHRSCGFLLSAIPFILIPPLKKNNWLLIISEYFFFLDYFRWLGLEGGESN